MPIGQASPVLPFSGRGARSRFVQPQASGLCKNRRMELTWYGRTCIRLKGKDAVVVNDPYPALVGPTGRGITADVVTFSHPDDAPLAKKPVRTSRDGLTAIPTSLESAFFLDGPGEYEVHDALVTGVRTYRDDERGARRGRQTAFVTELDGLHTIHLGDIGHELTQEKLADIGRVDIACVPVGGALTAAKAAALIAQLDPKIVVPMPVCEVEADCDEALKQFLHEMGAEGSVQPKLLVTATGLPAETTTVVLESRGKA
jgi:L-ascorbate metabolism protein UlaG (beta-lactamase superfamily)